MHDSRQSSPLPRFQPKMDGLATRTFRVISNMTNFLNGTVRSTVVVALCLVLWHAPNYRQGTYGQLAPGMEAASSENVLWYQQPAAKWEQALPVGDGRLGAAVFGGVDKERIIYNEDSLWSGWLEPNNDREGAYKALQKIRKLLKKKGRPETGQ